MPVLSLQCTNGRLLPECSLPEGAVPAAGTPLTAPTTEPAAQSGEIPLPLMSCSALVGCCLHSADCAASQPASYPASLPGMPCACMM